MHTPILLTASSNSTIARTTYSHIEKHVRKRFPNRDIHWGYSDRVVTMEHASGNRQDIRKPSAIIRDLADSGHKEIVVQSLHLLPGHEFHTLYRQVRSCRTTLCKMGLPLLSSEQDYETFIELLAPVIEDDKERFVVVVGHGTRHPVWTAYLALERLLQDRFGKRIATGVVEHSPKATHLEERILATGYEKVLLIPFFLLTGMHFLRDMIGSAPTSWKSRLEAKGLEVTWHQQGIGMLPGIEKLIGRHIEEAGEVEDMS